MTRTSTRPRANSPLNLPTAFQLWRPSKELILKNSWFFGPLYAIPFIFSLHNWLWSPVSAGGGQHWTNHIDNISASWAISPTADYLYTAFVGFALIWFIFVLVAGTIIQVMSQSAQLEAAQGKPLHFHRLWLTAKKLGLRMFGLYLIVGMLVSIGFVLLIIPGLILLRRYFLAPYVMIDKDCSIKEALDRSATLSKPFSGNIWGIIGVMLLIGLVSLIPFIGVLTAIGLSALYSAAPALRYQQIKNLV